MMKKFIAAFIALAMLVALMPASLADSDDVQPYKGWIGADSPLYKVKIFVQKMDVYLTFDSKDKMVKQMNYANERLSEIKAAALKDDMDAVNISMDEYERQMDELNDTAEAPDIDDAVYANLSPMLYHHQQAFYAMMNNSSMNWTIQGRYMIVNGTITKMKNGMPLYYFNGTAYFIPPGQMKKMKTDPSYVPPGLAKKGYKKPVPTITNGSKVWPWDDIDYSFGDGNWSDGNWSDGNWNNKHKDKHNNNDHKDNEDADR